MTRVRKTNETWFRIVGFGCTRAPRALYRTRDAAETARVQASNRDSTGYTGAHTRVYEYSSRAAAKNASISDAPGEEGRVS